jgi:peptidoglycan/xylan/chitin deacetylase (PgdA/CDA1 family)
MPSSERPEAEARAGSLTFDDGPSEWTAPILDLFATHGGHATFFVLGAAVAGCEDVLRRALAEGHELGNHTFAHHDPGTLDEPELRRELSRGAEAIATAVGTAPTLVRPPYCGDGERVARVAAEGGFGRTILRSVDPADWRTPDADAIAEHVLAEAVAGSIVCLHDGVSPRNSGLASRESTVRALELLLPALLQRGYRLVTVSELLR